MGLLPDQYRTALHFAGYAIVIKVEEFPVEGIGILRFSVVGAVPAIALRIGTEDEVALAVEYFKFFERAIFHGYRRQNIIFVIAVGSKGVWYIKFSMIEYINFNGCIAIAS